MKRKEELNKGGKGKEYEREEKKERQMNIRGEK